jgi:hypothetical protein
VVIAARSTVANLYYSCSFERVCVVIASVALLTCSKAATTCYILSPGADAVLICLATRATCTKCVI